MLNITTDFFSQLYEFTTVNSECLLRMELRNVQCSVNLYEGGMDGANHGYGLFLAVCQGAPNKYPGCNVISLELYKPYWDVINDMLRFYNPKFQEAKIISGRKAGLAISLPKNELAMKPGDYRPTTLINTHYNFLARILANNMRKPLTTLMHPVINVGCQAQLSSTR